MKKVLCLIGGIIIALGFVLTFSHTHTGETSAVGTYQCATCGLIMKITTSGSTLPARDFYGDGHTHDWRYIGGLSGTIRPIR